MTQQSLKKFYHKLFDHFGPQNWWPGDTPLEICIGAILTQNTNWKNVEKAIENLKKSKNLNLVRLGQISQQKLAELIKPAGYFNVKAKRLKNFISKVISDYGSLEELQSLSDTDLRNYLLTISGIGPETADSMVLYAFERPSFVIDAYTKRILVRHGLVSEEANYYEMKDLFETHLEENTDLFNEYHALIVQTGKDFCKKSRPNCEECPLHFDLNE